MAILTGSTIASSYDQLLALPTGGGDGATLVALTDGNAGNTFALQVSTGGIKSTGTLNVAGITTATGGVVGDLTGDVTGDLTGDVTGDLTGNVTAASVLADGVTATTQAVDNDSTKVATTAFVVAQVETSDTLAEVLANGGTATSSALAGVMSDETGSGSLAFATSPTLVTPALGTPTSGALTNCTFPTLNQDTTGTAATVTGATQAAITSAANLATVGTITTGTWEGDTVAVDQGGTGATSLTSGSVLLGSGTGAITPMNVLSAGEIIIGDGVDDPARLVVGADASGITILGTIATGIWNGTVVANDYCDKSLVSLSDTSLSSADPPTGALLYWGGTSWNDTTSGTTHQLLGWDQDEKARLTIGDGGSSTYGGSPSLFFNKSETGTSIIHFNKAGADDAYIQHDADEGLAFGTNNTNQLYITDAGVSKFTGSLGVARTASTYELEVGGTVYATQAGTGTTEYGVLASVTGAAGTNYGGRFASSGATVENTAVYGISTGGGVTSYGGVFSASGASATHYGLQTTTSGTITGSVYGGHLSAGGTVGGDSFGVYGITTAVRTAGTHYGVYGTSTASGAGTRTNVGGYFTASNGATNIAVHADGPIKIVDGTQGDGKILTSDANGLATWEAGGGGVALTGSTPETICTVTGADAIQGEANLVFDGTSLGIGTTTPGSHQSDANNLVVGTGSGDEGITIFCGSSAGDYGNIYFSDATSAKQGQIRYEQNNEIMSFWTAATQRMTIDLGGKVGIGTASPHSTGKLTVLGYTIGGSNYTDATTKYMQYGCLHYTNAEEPVAIAGGYSASGASVVQIGGGFGNFNAATDIIFYTADDTTTPTGTERLRVGLKGQVFQPVETTTTVSSGGAATFAIDYSKGNYQKLILDSGVTALTLTNTTPVAGCTVKLYIDVETNSPFLSSVTAPGWKWFTDDLTSTAPSYDVIIELTCWSTTNGSVSANVLAATY